MRKILLALLLTVLLAGVWVPAVSAEYCIDRYVQDVNECATLGSWVDRSACGLVAAARYAECLARAIRG